jgi:hypothetical protein
MAQNVDSDKAKAQGEEKVMKEKEKGATGTSQDQTGQASSERLKSDDSRGVPNPSEPDYTGGKPKPSEPDYTGGKPKQ